ncbi:ribokinase [Plesiomonas shigelloides]|uniref:Ribokinase n=1 Tax=Plesiomonas shigelloides TaxID=703 RepID=A0A8I1W8X4_PLESH|nr:PfkB family carbohydrate kinase [Plesiomonas shigelloides]MBO1109533.1 ribokinase [Plesiomonas shigelloides]
MLNLTAQTPVMVIGAAFGDVMLSMQRLPRSGGDEVASETGRQIGGCAFNVARVLSRLGMPLINGIPVGTGIWGEAVARAMQAESLPVHLRNREHDNGWCLALVEPSGERTFVTVEGCEQFWDTDALEALLPQEPAWVYASGYEIASNHGKPLLSWLTNLPTRVKLFIDLGPRISELCPQVLATLLGRGTLLTLNREEAAQLLKQPATPQNIAAFCQAHHVPLIVRQDKDGALVGSPDGLCHQVMPVSITACDTIGAGDAHCGATLAGLMSGLPLVEAVQLGNLVAAIVVSRPGADGAPYLAELSDYALPAIQQSN